MRLWHIDLIPYLPKSQLIAQWRELNSIFKKQDNHILINYIYNYPKSTLKTYADKVVKEMQNRGYEIKKWDNYNEYFEGVVADGMNFKEHNDTYFEICYWNLYEKYIRGQKDFDVNVFYKLDDFYNSTFYYELNNT